MTMRAKAGFSMAELVLGMLSAAILAVTVGSILFYMNKAVARNSAVADLERDALVALRTLDTAIRAASTNPAPVVTTNQLRIVAGGNTRTFSVVGGNLYYNANGTSGGMELVGSGRLAEFSAQYVTPPPRVLVTLRLTSNVSDVSMSVSNMCIGLRN